MDLDILSNRKIFELLPVGAAKGRKAHPIKKKRVLVGRSQACDIVIPHNEVTAIHAVIEIHGDRFKVYDMNSTNGTFINGKKIIVEMVSLGDKIKLGPLEFELALYKPEDVAPPPLDLLRPELPPAISGGLTPREMPKKPLPVAPGHDKVIKETHLDIPEVVYPLASDPKAEFSEYIFEDADTIYPIFRYEMQRAAVEIIILFKDKIHSVDYLPLKDGMFRLVGKKPSSSDIEYAYLGINDKIDFIEIRGSEIFVSPLTGYECMSLSENARKPAGSIHLSQDDILRFYKGDLQIFVRSTESPPFVKPAPIFRRDDDLKKYLFFLFFLSFAFLSAMSFYPVDETLEQEKVPERIATILYQKRPVVSVNPAVDKTEDKPKEVVQKSPEQVKPEKPKETPKAAERKQDQKPTEKVGSKTAVKTGEVKKAEANKGPQDRIQDKVRPERQQQQAAQKAQTESPRKAPINSAAKGNVDTYKSPDFSSTVSSLLARGGSTRAAQAQSSASSARSETGIATGGESATLKRAEVSGQVGALSGSAQGRLDETRGVEGLVSQRNIYTAGLPFKEVVLGGMDPDTIRRILIDHIPQFRHCYQKELDRATNEFDGVVRLDFIIGASGHVTRAGVQAASDSLPDNVKGCVVNVLKGIKFPEPMGGGVVEVNQPFNFYPRRN